MNYDRNKKNWRIVYSQLESNYNHVHESKAQLRELHHYAWDIYTH